jgi:site-specific recombinase XerD
MKHETQLQLFDPDLSETRGGPTPRLLDLRTFYNEVFLPDSKALAKNTLQKYRTAIGHWESCVKRKSIETIGRVDVRRFRDEMVARGELQASGYQAPQAASMNRGKAGAS